MQSRQVSRANDRELVGRFDTQRFFGRTMAFDSELETKVMALTAEQVTAALKKYIDPNQMTFYRAGDFKKARCDLSDH